MPMLSTPNILKKLALAGLTVALLAQGACSSKAPADLLVAAQRIYTLDSAHRTVQAMVVRDGKVLASGQMNELLLEYAPVKTLKVPDKVVYPGWNDAHCHFVGYAEMQRQVNLRGTQSYQAVLERVKAFAQRYDMDYIRGRGWDQNDWPRQAFPDRAALDSLFPRTPVILKRIDGHAALVNGAALRAAGVPQDTAVAGGELLRRSDGSLSGVLIDRATALVRAPGLTRAQRVQALLDAQEKLLAVGLTSLTDAGLPRADIELIDSLQKAGDLQLRINAMVADDSSSLAYFLEEGPIETPRLRVHSAKFYWDGALGSRGALLLEPYADKPQHHGLQLYSLTHYRRWARRLAEAGWQMAVHAIGDSAVRQMIRLTQAVSPEPDHRWRVEHAQIVHPRDVAAMAQAGLLPSVQPTHATSDMYWAGERLGEREKRGYIYANLLAACGKMPLGTDFPVEQIDPLRTYRAAVFRQDSSGYPEGGYFPEQALSPEEALRGMTQWGAYASFEEGQKGQLLPGQQADFVLYDRDITQVPLDTLTQLKPAATYLAGQKVYSTAP
ncbi:MAG: amidohydrolase [Schleiferiaceae bacterium]|nr:amidohydrolase [Schleiferiaceae bacterium]